MQQRWTLYIKDFGKIEEAKVEIAPFIIFVGENNTGKSYLISLLWGLLVVGRNLFPQNPPKTEIYNQCVKFIDKILAEKDEYLLDNNDYQLFIDFFNNVLKEKKAYLIKKIFSTDNLNIKNIEIINYSRKERLKIQFTNIENEKQRFSSGKNYIKFPIDKTNLTNSLKYKMIQYICWKLLMEDLSSPLFPLIEGKRASGEPLFLPASRTGFMLTYKSLASEVMNVWGYEEEINSKFTLPIIKFLQALIQLKESKRSKYNEIIDFLQNEILNGKIITEERVINDYKYRPKNMRNDLPLYITSSLVVELSPLFIFLKSNLKFHVLIIEELESHLHPKIQKQITRLIIWLVNSGIPVWITTHSDIIFQQINNMIKLFNSPNRDDLMKQFKYYKNDILNPNEVKAYEFVVHDNKSKVKELTLTDIGFEVPTFNKALMELSEETIAIEEGLNV